MKKEYEIVVELSNACAGSGRPQIYVEEAELENPDDYVRMKMPETGTRSKRDPFLRRNPVYSGKRKRFLQVYFHRVNLRMTLRPEVYFIRQNTPRAPVSVPGYAPAGCAGIQTVPPDFDSSSVSCRICGASRSRSFFVMRL